MGRHGAAVPSGPAVAQQARTTRPTTTRRHSKEHNQNNIGNRRNEVRAELATADQALRLEHPDGHRDKHCRDDKTGDDQSARDGQRNQRRTWLTSLGSFSTKAMKYTFKASIHGTNIVQPSGGGDNTRLMMTASSASRFDFAEDVRGQQHGTVSHQVRE
jgi:hypothetical protein